MNKQKKDWEGDLIVNVMEDYIFCIRNGGSLEEARSHFEKLKSFISSLIDETEKEAYERGRRDLLDECPDTQFLIGLAVQQAKDELRAEFLNQPANQHDQEVRNQAQSEIREDLIKWIRKRPILYAGYDEDVINYLNKLK